MRTNEFEIEMPARARRMFVFGECTAEKGKYAGKLAEIGARCGVLTRDSGDETLFVRIVTEMENKEKARAAGFDIIREGTVSDDDKMALFISMWMADKAGVDFALSSCYKIKHIGQNKSGKERFWTMEFRVSDGCILPRVQVWHLEDVKNPSVPHAILGKGSRKEIVTVGTGMKKAVKGNRHPGLRKETMPVANKGGKKTTKMDKLEIFFRRFPAYMKEKGISVSFIERDAELIVRENPNNNPNKRAERSRLGAFIPPVRIENMLSKDRDETESVFIDHLRHAMASTYAPLDRGKWGELQEEIPPHSSQDKKVPFDPEKTENGGIALYRMSCERTIEAYGEKLTWNEGYGRPLVFGDGGITIRLIEDADSEDYASAMDVQHVTADAAVKYDAVRKVVQELIIRNMIMKGIPLMEGDGKFSYFFHPHDAKNSSTKEFEMTISEGRMEIHQVEHKSKNEDDYRGEPSRDLVGRICLDGETWHDILHTSMLFIPETESISDPTEKLKKAKETFTGFRYFRDGNDTFYCAGKGKDAYKNNIATFPNIYRTDLSPEYIESQLSTYAIRLNDETSLPWQFAFIRRYAESLEEHNVPQEKKEEDKEKKEKKKK